MQLQGHLLQRNASRNIEKSITTAYERGLQNIGNLKLIKFSNCLNEQPNPLFVCTVVKKAFSSASFMLSLPFISETAMVLWIFCVRAHKHFLISGTERMSSCFLSFVWLKFTQTIDWPANCRLLWPNNQSDGVTVSLLADQPLFWMSHSACLFLRHKHSTPAVFSMLSLRRPSLGNIGE